MRAVQSSPWTAEDRALMLAWRRYQDTLCPGCGFPRGQAWHPYQDGWYEVHEVGECQACHAKALHEWREAGSKDNPPKPHVFTVTVDTRNHDADPLPPMPAYRPTPIPGQELPL